MVHVTGSFLVIEQFPSWLIPKHFLTVSKDKKKINSFELEIQSPFGEFCKGSKAVCVAAIYGNSIITSHLFH